MVKTIIVVAFIGVVVALGSAMFHLVSNKKGNPEKYKADSNSLFKALAWRIGLSMSLFLFLMISYYAGWIKPEGTLTKLMEQGQNQAINKK